MSTPEEPDQAPPPQAGPPGAEASPPPPGSFSTGPPPSGSPDQGAPPYGAPPYGAPGYGPPYGSPQYGAPQPGASQYGPSYPAAQYGSAYGTSPYEAPAGQPSKAMAIWALVLGWIPCLIGMVVSVVLAIVVLSRSRDGRNHGKGMAIGGLVGVGVWVVVVIAALAIHGFSSAQRDAGGHLTRGGDVTISGLRVGDCGTEELSGLTRTVHVVPCSQAHVFEVLATFQMPDGPYPGDDQVKRLAVGGCVKRAGRIPALKGRTDLHLTYLHPIASTWDIQKTVVCMANTDQPTTGSLTGN